MIKDLIKKAIYPAIKSPPDFLVIGAQKAGTTSLYNYLTQHPQVIGNKSWKEIRYFDLPQNYSRGYGWYLGNFPSKVEKGDRLTFDASPSYLHFDNIPARIKADLGEIKMIAILREPVKRAYSAWQMYQSFFDNPNDHLRVTADDRSFAAAVEQELQGKAKEAKYPYDYVARGKYAEQLERYYKQFDKSQILVLNFAQFKQDLPGLLNQVCEFLEIEPFSPETLQQFQQKRHNVGKYEIDLDDQAVMDQLKEYFIPYNQKLYDLVGQNYNW
jgi:hypothetical protein